MEMLKSLKDIDPNAALLTCVSLDLKEQEGEETENNDERTETAIENQESTFPELSKSFF